VQDCTGEWGGDLIVDECDICGGDNSTCEDCSGTPNGSAYYDECGTCDSDVSNDCAQDCAGVWGGSAVYETYYLDVDGDGLGYGSANSYCSAFVPSGWVDNNDDLEPDCATNDTDQCGVCSGDSSTCSDCAGTPNGSAYEDECDVCDSDASNDCVQDCAGVWGGSAYEDTYYLDVDGDGLGAGNGYELCNGFDLTGWVANNTDSDDNCASNVHDCSGVCDGGSEIDECGECGGDGIDDGACDCAGNVDDCAGVCGGMSYEDDCGVCNGPGAVFVCGCDSYPAPLEVGDIVCV
jgi:hypothetical protein